MDDSLRQAVEPDSNAVVHAAAGTGKTWLLTSRILRLLMAGAAPGSILAITFTRKAAQEMSDRVHHRLFEMASAEESTLRVKLSEIGIPYSDMAATTARSLYERVLASPHPLRTTTFHAFCQELLQRFAYEAGIAPAFEVIEDNTTLRREAWHAFTRELTQSPSIPAAAALDRLLRDLGSLVSVRDALHDFLEHASDWWAFTEGQENVEHAAMEKLASLYGPVDPDPIGTLLRDNVFRDLCRRFLDAAGMYPEPSLQVRVEAAEAGMADSEYSHEHFDKLVGAFLTQDGTPRKLATKPGNRTATTGESLSRLHSQLCTVITETLEAQKTVAAVELTSAWYQCGARLLWHYQRLKQQHNQLDFADLEWQTYSLLNRADHAEWVQYKLDQRIDHLLIDEFQDTNPTQWRLVLPLLQQLAAGDPERQRSAFLVGDEKQSIYRFRRAEPRLFKQAHDWLVTHAGAHAHTQDHSWRSSPAILTFVNILFGRDRDDNDPVRFPLADFRTHDARFGSRPGYVEVRPLVERAVENERSSDDRSGFRNPLTTARESEEDRRYGNEAKWIADRIHTLIDSRIRIETGITYDAVPRALQYGDIFVLLRDRTHAQAYEDALRDAGIPFFGASRDQFHDALEVRDLINLLRVLISPFDDLALAGVLRSPIFGFGDDALMRLAAYDGDSPWWQRLMENGAHARDDEIFAQAGEMLSRWHLLADRIPVHDLLDRIFFEGDIAGRYESAAPAHLRTRVRGNLTRFVALALEFDSGRYPSLARFLRQFESTRFASAEPGSDAAPSIADDGVRIMTVHAAKGLEAPVVFLADATRGGTLRKRVPWTLVNWPPQAAGPVSMLLGGRLDRLDRTARTVYASELAASLREEANLLYVAITRARQILFISGCTPVAGDDQGWYGFIQPRLKASIDAPPAGAVDLRCKGVGADDTDASTGWRLSFGDMPTGTDIPPPPPTGMEIDPRLFVPLKPVVRSNVLRPSELRTEPVVKSANLDAWRDSRTRGVVIHRALDLATQGINWETARNRFLQDYAPTMPVTWLDECWDEAIAVIAHPPLRDLFDPSHFHKARNELPLLFRDGADEVHGVVDRVVLTQSLVTIIDYKTNRIISPQDTPGLAKQYTPQILLYARGVGKIWPSTPVRALLLFTHTREVVEVPLRT